MKPLTLTVALTFFLLWFVALWYQDMVTVVCMSWALVCLLLLIVTEEAK